MTVYLLVEPYDPTEDGYIELIPMGVFSTLEAAEEVRREDWDIIPLVLDQMIDPWGDDGYERL